MIVQLDHTTNATSKRIRIIFQAAYAVEAKLLKVVDFPPLQRPLAAFLNGKNTFYGYHKNQNLKGVIELKMELRSIHIQSLVVHPDSFREGMASALLQFVLDTHDVKSFTVETGLDNHPAKNLYQQFGFQKTKEWDTDHGVRKVAFKLIRDGRIN